MMQSAAIRQAFLDFFQSKGHTIVPSAPVVIKDDPTLLFTNAGMNQFKDYFLGNRKPAALRIADTQKCLRVSGKHNDLEEVGVDTYHHTLFEMLGNWSFGDYFKEEAIAWAWELLTEVYGIDRQRLYVTVFEGDEKEGLPRDAEAVTCWKNWVPQDRILMGNKKDNFWEMGDTGPCGPCTEIHYDSRTAPERDQVDGKTLVNAGHPQVIEIWNLVFIQFNRRKDGSLEPLPARHVDTGMGFERLVRVLQQKQSNYDTDLFTGTISEVERLAGKKYGYSGTNTDVAFRVIADHIRAICFTIADGQMPSNTGAGYVIRRILRRAVRYYFSYLDVKAPLLYKLVRPVAEQFRNVFPELHAQLEFVGKVVLEEEQNFLSTLEKGMMRLEHYHAQVAGTKSSGGGREGILPGSVAFELYDTFGFPLDLTALIAAEKGLAVDEAGFQREMQRQKDRSRAATAVDTGDWIVLRESREPEFAGYDTFETDSHILRYRKTRAQGRDLYQVVLDRTPFYPEGGGQVGDIGILEAGGVPFRVLDTRRENNLVLHYTESVPTDPSAGIAARIDLDKRARTAVHHSATHLLHAALRKILGPHVQQKGSLVNADHLRFDFSHFAKLSEGEIAGIEKMVNEKIRENIPVVIRQMNKDEAIAMGAMALFGEKYGDTVRVVIIDPSYSIELCGGTHVGNTGAIGFFRITAETAVGAGIRRIEAVGGPSAAALVEKEFENGARLRALLKNPRDVVGSVEALLAENATLRKELEKAGDRHLALLEKELLEGAQQVNGVSFIGAVVDAEADALKKICFALKGKKAPLVVVLASGTHGKAAVALLAEGLPENNGKFDAAKIIREHIAPLIGGGGGGQKTLATAGGQDTSRLPQVIEKVRSLL